MSDPLRYTNQYACLPQSYQVFYSSTGQLPNYNKQKKINNWDEVLNESSFQFIQRKLRSVLIKRTIPRFE